MATESTEMYLITIYRLTLKAMYASTSDIAATLDVSLPSVSEKVRRLAEQGYVYHEWRQGVSLTARGREVALNVLRKHRLAATFLVQMAGYLLDEVYEEACRLEHVMSDRLADRLEELLGYPRVDPYGYPIPGKDGTIAMEHYPTLACVSAGATVVVQRINDLDQARLRYISELGLVPNAQVEVLEVAPFEGPLVLKIDDRTVAIAYAIACEIEVEEVMKEV